MNIYKINNLAKRYNVDIIPSSDSINANWLQSMRTQQFKEKTYIKNPEEAPPGANVQKGPKGGLYYDDKSSSKTKEEKNIELSPFIDEINEEIEYQMKSDWDAKFSMLKVDNAINMIVDKYKYKRNDANNSIRLFKLLKEDEAVKEYTDKRNKINKFLYWISKDKNKFSFLMRGDNYYKDNETKTEKTYIKNPEDAPKGANVKEGPKGGLYYDGVGDKKQEEPVKIKQDNPDADKVKELFKENNWTLDDLASQKDNWTIMRIIRDNLTFGRDLDHGQKGMLISNAIIDAFPEEFGDRVWRMISKWTMDESSEKINDSHDTARLLGSLSFAAHSRDNEARQEFVNKVRDIMNGDVKNTNKALKYMGFRERVKKGGMKQSAQNKTVEEVKESLKEVNYEGISYQLSPNYIKNTKIFKSEQELSDNFKKVINTLPEKARDIIKGGDTKVHFVTRPEAKKISNACGTNSAAGYYLPSTNQIFIFPSKGYGHQFRVSPEELKEAGYDDNVVRKMTDVIGKESWRFTVSHELAHAVALNPQTEEKWGNETFQLQDDYEQFILSSTGDKELMQNDLRKELNYISRYATTNPKEDFADTMAFYASNKDIVDSAIEKEEGWMTNILKEKFKWLRDNLW